MPDLATPLTHAAADVLRANDRGEQTVAAPLLYPHQWSWDAAFVAIGWGTVSVPRALDELRHLLRGQWRTGMIPQILFSAEPGYFPGPQRWRTVGLAAAPSDVVTSGICQPAVHSLAVWIIGEQAHRNGGADAEAFDLFLADTFDAWLAWHTWLDDARGTHPSGLIEIHHPWESGMDNSPRWDAACARVRVGEMAPYIREDTKHVADSGERPADADYDRYLWLVEQLVSVRYDDAAAREVIDFRVGDVFFTAVHALSADLLARLGTRLGRTTEAATLREMAARARAAVAATVDPGTGHARDYDMRAGEWLTASTIGGFAALICGAEPREYTRLVADLLGPAWCGHASLANPLPPTTSPDSPVFVSRNYWRGPQWPVITWLFTWALRHHGESEAADAIAAAGRRQLADGTFAEYYDAVSGAALGSRDQSWTAAAALAWAAEEDA
ncbi:glycogen debranching protein [Occultella glacieicola]|uniref:Glycogen debranching protein n=1 Tax=Occultella glacieicola TaxID=2518684 RepID=A0ABY2E7U6_9MICO|nr:glycoside hydrolase 100 family protein [Occultella glacieicola]TDE95911.1 glycogen debranching protein [Occultella glacieicola]